MRALVNPEMLRWARERASLAVPALARKLSVNEIKIHEWEVGETKPTFRQAQEIAHSTHVPFGYLFLQNPPEEEQLIPDLRTVNGAENRRYSLDLAETIRSSKDRQNWYKEYLREQGIARSLVPNGFGQRSNTSEIVQSIRTSLGISAHPSRGTADEYFSDLVKRTESLGVLVMRNSCVGSNTTRKLSVEEFRGFALADDLAPVIFINTADCPEARLFTLAHELAHIWIGASGVSDNEPNSHRHEEAKCNEIAAELLVPREEFLALWSANEEWQANVAITAGHFHVSRWVTARRALSLQIISVEEYRGYIAARVKAWKEREQTGRPTYNRLQRGRVSETFARAVASEAMSGRVLLRDASKLIGIKPQNIASFARKELGL
ncbi:XRE family transcriptional regulator [Stutzerimonas xanthomarina]|uniref:XRE family transcriptional regulator n=1 Tax=Stutzerimonas xanthomarina TaxID=271420 RepID=UPI0029AF0B7F|nr:XRE family transcriptional regulator [Stutzerimonas xanthomarina]MDX2351636.1 XRE family transcriptional regulator [Stutzerimonas xanthomarina]